MRVTRIILLGPPGAGKGTQAGEIAANLNIPQISTGDLLRAARKAGTSLGREAQKFMDVGKLVSDELVIALVKERLSAEDAQRGYILDGFPRNILQAEALATNSIKIECVLNLVVPDEVLLRRLSKRRVCRNCGASFHLEYRPTKVVGVCDLCNRPTYQRTDDFENIITKRLATYKEQTHPLINYYSARGILRTVHGDASFKDVQKTIEQALNF